MKFIIFILTLSLYSFANQFHLIKDGKTAYCPPTQNQKESNSNKFLKLKLLGNERGEFFTELKFEVKFVKCEGSKWIQDSAPTVEKYNKFLPDNTPVVISVKYSDLKIMVLNESSEELVTIPLKNILTTGLETVRVKVKNRTFNAIELAPVIKRSFFVDEKFHSEDLVFFGSYLLNAPALITSTFN